MVSPPHHVHQWNAKPDHATTPAIDSTVTLIVEHTRHATGPPSTMNHTMSRSSCRPLGNRIRRRIIAAPSPACDAAALPIAPAIANDRPTPHRAGAPDGRRPGDDI